MIRVAILTTDNREHHRKYELPDPYFGPAIEAVLQGLSGWLDFEIHVVSCTQRPMHAPEKLSANTWFHLLHVPKIGWLRTGYQGCVRAIRGKLHELRPDIVHGQGTERECALSAIFSGFPNVVTIHGNMSALARRMKASVGSYLWFAAMLERFTLPRTLGVFCNSAYTESMVRRRARRTWRVPNAIRREFFDTPLAPKGRISKPILLNIGTISPHKRQLELLELTEKLHQEGHSFDLQFIGAADPGNSYAAAFLDRVATAERDGFARYLGTKSLGELIDTVDAATALIHAPSEEAFGLVVAEALARNLKVFGTKIGGMVDIVADVEGAELFPLNDSAALGSAIARWLRAGFPRPESPVCEMRFRYHPDVIARHHSEIYREILAARHHN
jgi:glycosyltransferase involved in cell wall biosynthesis